MGHGTVAGQDSHGQASDHLSANETALQKHRPNRTWGKSLPQGRGTAGRRETPTGGTVRWHTPEAEQASSPRRLTASTVQDRTQRATNVAPRGRMRDVRVNGGHRSSQHPRTSRPERERPRSKAHVDTDHGGTATEDPSGLPDVPPGHPRWA